MLRGPRLVTGTHLSKLTTSLILQGIQCDQSIPSCGQCLKAGRNCCGYRNRMDLLFRNETNKVTAKARTSKTYSATGRRDVLNSEGRSDTALTCQLNSAPSPLRFIPRSLSIPLEDEATNYFFHSYVLSDPVISSTFLSYVPTLYKNGADASPLPEIIASIGMASISNIKNDPRIMFAARRKHALVLQAINRALQDPESAKLDTTFAAVLLLCLFEVSTVLKYLYSFIFIADNKRLLRVLPLNP